MGSALQHKKIKTTIKEAFFSYASENYNIIERLFGISYFCNLWNSSDAKTRYPIDARDFLRFRVIFCIYKQSIGFRDSLFEATMGSGTQPFFTFNSCLMSIIRRDGS